MIDGGVELLLVAMKMHLVSVSVNVAVCKTLSHLYMILGNLHLIISVLNSAYMLFLEVCRERQVIEMIDCVLLAMRVHQQNLTIQKHACSLIELLADNRMLPSSHFSSPLLPRCVCLLFVLQHDISTKS
jgi:hypothetical protein